LGRRDHAIGGRARAGWLKVAAAVLCVFVAGAAHAQTIRVGSKNFAEQFTVADIYAEALEDAGFKVERRINLGATWIVHSALMAGQIDLYPEYTGTALTAVVKQPNPGGGTKGVYDLVKRHYNEKLGLTLLEPTGINNGYAIVVRPDTAAKYHLTTLSSLTPVAGQLVIGAPGEFAAREDGILGLKRVYGINFKTLKAFAEMTLRYKALLSHDIDAINAYSTDWQIADNKLVVLQDDKALFPPYQLAPVVRLDTLAAHPRIAEVLNRIAPLLTDEKMRAMNAAVERDRREPTEVAHEFLVKEGISRSTRSSGAAACGTRPLCWTATHSREIALAVVQHLYLTLASVAIGLVIALVLGVISARRPRLYALFLTLSTAIFVIPSLALFALLIPIMGLGVWPALVGLSAYCILIILRNVVTGLRGVPADVLDAATGLGFDPWRRLVQIELPLALPLIVSGIRIALVTVVGIATVAAFINAGGLGTIILTGIEQSYPEKIIVGGGATALMAMSFDLSIAWLSRRFGPAREAVR
jgi:osmoprotectant transport system substrate-binding protein